MKKLMIAAAVACAAAFANAATASWAVGFLNDVDGNLLGPSSSGYTATFNVYSDTALSSLVATSSSSAWEDGMAFGETDNVLVNSSETTYYGQIIVSNGGDKQITSDGFQFTTSTLSDQAEVFVINDPGSLSGIEKIGGGDFTATDGAFATNGSDWQTIPEPTSGLLLLLGIAGLSLRRKRA